MQRVSALLPAWNSNRNTNPRISTTSLDKVRGWTDRIPSPGNRRSISRLSRDVLLPSTLDKECEKAARIVRSFCCDGFATPDDRPGTPSTYSSGQSSQLLKKVPPMIIQNAVGLAIFTSMRSGIWGSGSAGSGILIARKTDGSWSPPSGIMLQTSGLSFVMGVDVYDCLLVINNFAVLETFGRHTLTLGPDVGLTPGPLVTLGLLENDINWTDLSDTAITYVKSHGIASDVKLEGTVLNERHDENERFYGMRISVAKILSGDINQSLPQTRLLTEMLKAAEGRSDYDTTLVEQFAGLPSPGDATIESPHTSLAQAFGIPSPADPDPFGVMALESAGLEIREAGSRLRPESRQFEYTPSPTSPIFPKLVGRPSMDTFTSRSNRGSSMSNKTVATERSQSQMTDTGTQTLCTTAETTPSPSKSQSEDGQSQAPSEANSAMKEQKQTENVDAILENEVVKEPEEVDYTKIDISALRKLSNFPDLDDGSTAATTTTEKRATADKVEQTDMIQDTAPSTGSSTTNTRDDQEDTDIGSDEFDDDDEDDEEFEDEDDDAIVYEVATAQAPPRMAMMSPVQVKGAMVNIPKRIPPPLPSRNPGRMSRRRSQMVNGNGVLGPLGQEADAAPTPSEDSTPVAEEQIQTTQEKHTSLPAAAENNVARKSPSSEQESQPTAEVTEPGSPKVNPTVEIITATGESESPEKTHTAPIATS